MPELTLSKRQKSCPFPPKLNQPPRNKCYGHVKLKNLKSKHGSHESEKVFKAKRKNASETKVLQMG